MTVLRDGKRVQLDNVVFDTYEENGVNQLVIDFKVLGEKKTVGSVLKEAGNWTLSLGRMVVLSLTDLITGRIAVNNLSGPVGIVSAISEASSLGLSSLLMLLALITINLGILTFCPFPRWTADGWYSLSSRRSAENPSAKNMRSPSTPRDLSCSSG